MNYDEYGRIHISDSDLAKIIHVNPDINLRLVLVDDPEKYNNAVTRLCADFPKLEKYTHKSGSLEKFDKENQSHWYMPEEYKNMDIAKWILDQCKNEHELQRVGQELLLYADRELLPLLCFLKYMVDTFRENDIVWGVGRGSSVASYVLFLLGIHKVDSIYYDLDVTEFLR